MGMTNPFHAFDPYSRPAFGLGFLQPRHRFRFRLRLALVAFALVAGVLLSAVYPIRWFEAPFGGGAAAAPAYYDLPTITVNIGAPDRSYLLSLGLTLGFDDPRDTAKLEKVLPRITDGLNVYLRQIDIRDLNRSEALYVLASRLNKIVGDLAPQGPAVDVLFREIQIAPSVQQRPVPLAADAKPTRA
jgi:flagellar basal body-associated protein FliL